MRGIAFTGLLAIIFVVGACGGPSDDVLVSEDSDYKSLIISKGKEAGADLALINCDLATGAWDIVAAHSVTGSVSVTGPEVTTDAGIFNTAVTANVNEKKFSGQDITTRLKAGEDGKTRISVSGPVFDRTFAAKVAAASQIEIRALGQSFVGKITPQLRESMKGLAKSCPALPTMSGETFAGSWNGHYLYNKARTDFARVLSADKKAGKGAFYGESLETTDGRGNTFFLSASIKGAVDANGKFSFKKAYEASSGLSQDIRYEGRLDRGGNHASGQWHMGDESGEFELERR